MRKQLWRCETNNAVDVVRIGARPALQSENAHLVRLGVGAKPFAGGGEAIAVAMTKEQTAVKGTFQRVDAAGDGRGVDAEGVARVPPHLTDEEAAALPCAALTAWNAVVTHGGVRAGDVILIQGCGGVSLFALLFAKLHGARVIILSSSDERLERAKSLGADVGINYRTTPEWGRVAREHAGRDGVDHVIEVGGSATLPQSLRAVRAGGTLSLIGVLSGAKIDAGLGPIVTRQVRLQGISCGSRDGFESMLRAIDQHQLRSPIDRVFAFEELHPALAHLATGTQFGKVCLRF